MLCQQSLQPAHCQYWTWYTSGLCLLCWNFIAVNICMLTKKGLWGSKKKYRFQVMLLQSGGHEIFINLLSELYYQFTQNRSCLVQPQNRTMPILALRMQVNSCLTSSPCTVFQHCKSDFFFTFENALKHFQYFTNVFWQIYLQDLWHFPAVIVYAAFLHLPSSRSNAT